MEWYINQEKAIESIKRKMPKVLYSEYGVGYERGLEDAIGLLNAFPTVDVQPVRHGYWSECYTDEHHYSGICSVCGGGAIRKVKAKPLDYCPKCGARMDLKDGNPNE